MTTAATQQRNDSMQKPHPVFARPHAARRRTRVIACDFIRKIRVTDASTGYAYDQTHRLASATDNRAASARVATAKTLNYSYSPGGLLNTLTDTEGNRTDYLYDPTGRLDGIWAPNLDYVSYTYDAGGRLTEKWFPNGINTQYAYNTDNTLTQVTNRIGYSDSATVSRHLYTYDGVGNRHSGQDQAGPLMSPVMNQASSYDPLNNRLTQSDGTTTCMPNTTPPTSLPDCTRAAWPGR
jgi:hypothetical protein